MFNKVKRVVPLSDTRLRILFENGISKVYDVKALTQQLPMFRVLIDDPSCFADVTVDTGGYGISWNSELDLSCEELWENGVTA